MDFDNNSAKHPQWQQALDAIDVTPAEILADRLIGAWCAAQNKQIPWAKAIEISAVVCKMADAEKQRLLYLDEDASQPAPSAADSAVEINRLRNVIQAACSGGLKHMLARWKELFPDAPMPTVHAAPGAAPVQGPNQFRKKPVVIEATQWFKNGDHPHDLDPHNPNSDHEGAIVRYFRHPDVSGETPCKHCGVRMHEHGWIDTLEGGHIVCPGDWVITGVKGERYPCKPEIFGATYEAASVPAPTPEVQTFKCLGGCWMNNGEPCGRCEKSRAVLAALAAQPAASPHRPSREWYAAKIQETLDDDFVIGAAQPAAQDLTDEQIRSLWQNTDTGDVEDDIMSFANTLLEYSEHQIIAAFLERTGQYVTNDATRDAAIADAVAKAQPAATQEPVAWFKTERMYHEYEGSAKADTVGWLSTRYAEKKPLHGEGWQPLYATPVSAPTPEGSADALDAARYRIARTLPLSLNPSRLAPVRPEKFDQMIDAARTQAGEGGSNG